MAKRVFFSFHYQDVKDFRANVVRNHWLTKDDRDDAGFFDASIWEEARKKGSVSLKRLINSGLEGTSVTCVLIGSDTYARPWVRYEIMKSFKRGNRLFGVHVNSIKDKYQNIKSLGANPFSQLGVTYSESGATVTLHEISNGFWREYPEVDEGASYRVNPVPSQYRGKGFNFSSWFPVYDWVGQNGYAHFSSWVGLE